MQPNPPADYRSAYPEVPFPTPGIGVVYHYQVQVFSDPSRPGQLTWERISVWVPQIGIDPNDTTFRWHPAVAKVDPDGTVHWDWSRAVRGQPRIQFPPRLSAAAERAQWDPGHIRAPNAPPEPVTVVPGQRVVPLDEPAMYALFREFMQWRGALNRDRFTGS